MITIDPTDTITLNNVSLSVLKTARRSRHPLRMTAKGASPARRGEGLPALRPESVQLSRCTTRHRPCQESQRDQPAIRSSDLAAAFDGFRGAILAVSVISGVINLLGLTGSLYMLQVYDRVLSSHSVPTLVSLSVLMFVLYAFYGVLDLLRNQASGRAAVLFDRRIAGPVHAVVVNLPLKGASRSTAQQPMRDVDTIRSFFASGGPVAFLDLPWMPLYLAFVFLLHPLARSHVLFWDGVAGLCSRS